MDYAQEAAFLRRYHAWAALAVLLIAASAAAFAIRVAVYSTSADVALFVIANLAFLAAVLYVPKYLQIRTDFNTRRVNWQVRIRWILFAMAVVYWVLFVRPASATKFFACLAGLALVNFLARSTGRRPVHGHQLAWLLFFTTDLALLAYLVNASGAPLLYALIPTISAFLLLSTAGPAPRTAACLVVGIYMALIAIAEAYFRSYALTWFVILGLSTLALSLMAKRHHERSFAMVAAELAEKFGHSETESRELIRAGSRIMAECWKKEPPNTSDPAALARWYSENSYWYLGANAEFHLTYKHVAFTLDVLRLAQGRCLDFGAGNGDLSLALARADHPTVHFDVPGTSMDFARWRAEREHLPVTFLSDTVELVETARRAGRFDTVISLDVLEHIPNVDSVLRMFNEVLAVGGRLIINIPFGETGSHPMHLNHSKLEVPAALRRMGLRDIKRWNLMLRSSELLRKSDVVIYEKPPAPHAGAATEPAPSQG
jgi:SAM-dependent methyltransferase